MKKLSAADQHWYRIFKGNLKVEGVNNPDTLYAAKHQAINLAKYARKLHIFVIIVSVPMMLLLIGIPAFFASLYMLTKNNDELKKYEWAYDLYAKEEFDLDGI